MVSVKQDLYERRMLSETEGVYPADSQGKKKTMSYPYWIYFNNWVKDEWKEEYERYERYKSEMRGV